MSAEWTQEDAVAYEAACECITHMMAVYTSKMHDASISEIEREEIKAKRSLLAQEKRELHVHEKEKIARIREEYGAVLRRQN